MAPRQLPSASSPLNAATLAQAAERLNDQIVAPNAVEVLKVSTKKALFGAVGSSQGVIKSRRFWIHLTASGIWIAWDKKGSKQQAHVPLSSLRDIRFGTSCSTFRSSLHLSRDVEERWFTLVYFAPVSISPPSSPPPTGRTFDDLPQASTGKEREYKLVHFIAPDMDTFRLVRASLEQLWALRLQDLPAGGSLAEQEEKEEAETRRMLKRLWEAQFRKSATQGKGRASSMGSTSGAGQQPALVTRRSSDSTTTSAPPKRLMKEGGGGRGRGRRAPAPVSSRPTPVPLPQTPAATLSAAAPGAPPPLSFSPNPAPDGNPVEDSTAPIVPGEEPSSTSTESTSTDATTDAASTDAEELSGTRKLPKRAETMVIPESQRIGPEQCIHLCQAMGIGIGKDRILSVFNDICAGKKSPPAPPALELAPAQQPISSVLQPASPAPDAATPVSMPSSPPPKMTVSSHEEEKGLTSTAALPIPIKSKDESTTPSSGLSPTAPASGLSPPPTPEQARPTHSRRGSRSSSFSSLLRSGIPGIIAEVTSSSSSNGGAPRSPSPTPPSLLSRLAAKLDKEEKAPTETLDFKQFQEFVRRLKERKEVIRIWREEVLIGEGGGGGESKSATKAQWVAFLKKVQGVTDEKEATRLFEKYSTSARQRSKVPPVAETEEPAKDGEVKVATEEQKEEDVKEDVKLPFAGFLAYLLSSTDAPCVALPSSSSKPGVGKAVDPAKGDMTRPLNEYYISSSHNTYLSGNQLSGDSTSEGYIRALQWGCRCVELDIWSGDEGEPVVTHGRTLTSKMTALEALKTIAEYAFVASPYPLVLSMEIHCDTFQQDRLVSIMKNTLGDLLLTAPLGLEPEQSPEDVVIEVLPSPEDLKGRILIKAKNLFITSSAGAPLPGIAPDASDLSDSSSNSSSDSEFKKVFQSVRRSFDERSRPGFATSSSNGSTVAATRSGGSVSATTSTNSLSDTNALVPTVSAGTISGKDASGKKAKPPMSFALAALLVYTIGVKARGFNKKESYAPTHVLSFGENRLEKMTKDPDLKKDLVVHNRGHLSRSYPKGSRVSSTNYLPHHVWAVGVQMVALNWQTFDRGMELNSAMFMRGDRSGYVLKPAFLRNKGFERDRDVLQASKNYRIEIDILSAQQLPSKVDWAAGLDPDASFDPFVEVTLFVPGVAGSPTYKRRSKVVPRNAFNPCFDSKIAIPFTVKPAALGLELVFVRFEVLNAKGKLKDAAEEGKGEFVGASCVVVGSLLPGYRHLPLYDDVGDQHIFSSLFIRSKTVELP